MKGSKKLLAGILGLALMLGVMPATPARAAEGPGIRAKEESIVYEAGEKKDLKVLVANTGQEEMNAITVKPVTDTKLKNYPFAVSNREEKKEIDSLKPGEEKELAFSFQARDDVKDKYYKIQFQCSATQGEEVLESSAEIVVQTKAAEKAAEQPQGGQSGQENQPGQATGGENGGTVSENLGTAYSYDDGGVYNSEPMSSGGGSTTASVPRVIVTGFSTDPAEVRAGSNFKLTLHLKNTSGSTRVQNMLFDLNAPTEGSEEATAAPAFLPVSGSSSIYLDQIPAGGTKDISIDLNAKGDLVQKPYSIQVSMKYEDSAATQYESESAVSIPVKQDPRFEFGEFQISPSSISVGEEANVMCDLYNLGRIKLYNVKAEFSGEGIKTETVFVGNVESGSSATIDAMIEGESVTAGPGTMKMTLSYEDESGTVSTTEQTFELEVTEDMAMTDMAMTDYEIEDQGGFPVLPVGIAVILAAGAAVTAILYRRKKKKRIMEEEEMIHEFDGLAEDESGESETP